MQRIPSGVTQESPKPAADPVIPTKYRGKYAACHKMCRPGVLDLEATPETTHEVAKWRYKSAREKTMSRTLPLVTLVFVVTLGRVAVAHLHEDGEKVRVLSTQDIKEQLDGEKAKATFVEVSIAPGQSGLAHRYPGPGFVYVLEGEYELGIDQQPTKVFEAGETFYEPTGCLHRVSRNPSATNPTRLIAVVLHPRDTDKIAIPVEANK
jgi:quercetin dioxygenase-like cupin family protein